MKSEFIEKRILIVEDERLMRNLLIQMVRRMGFKHVEAVESAETVVESGKYRKTDLLITDIEMDNMSGLDLIAAIRKGKSILAPELPIIVLTGMSKMPVLVKAAELKIQGFLTKPVSQDILHERVAEVLEKAVPLTYRKPERLEISDGPLADEPSPEESAEQQAAPAPKTLNNITVELDKLSVGMVLREDIAARGRTILTAGKAIQEGHVQVLKDLASFIDKKEVVVDIVK